MACKRSGVQVSSAAAGQWPVEDRGGMAASSQVAGMPQVMRVAPTEMGRLILAAYTPCGPAPGWSTAVPKYWMPSLAPAAPWSGCRGG